MTRGRPTNPSYDRNLLINCDRVPVYAKKLSVNQQLIVLKRHEAGASIEGLARTFGVDTALIQSVIRDGIPYPRATRKTRRCPGCGATIQTNFCLACYASNGVLS